MTYHSHVLGYARSTPEIVALKLSDGDLCMKNCECIIEQYRGDKLVRSFSPTGDQDWPWSMNVNGKSYRRTNGWVLSKILPTLVAGSAFTTKVIPAKGLALENGSEDGV